MLLIYAIWTFVLGAITDTNASPYEMTGTRINLRQQQPPHPNADGTCASYTVQSGDYCYKIASKFGISVNDLESFNKNTWGWKGCSLVDINLNICVSTGEIPMPMAVPDAQCGPQVAGTARPANMSTLPDLNPCRLNACCNAWGKCGATEQFCSKTTSPGCISHCGEDIIKSDPPTSFISVAYFQSFSAGRQCLRMDVSDIDTTKYTHLNFAFASITSNSSLDVSGAQAQFDKFMKLDSTKIKRIISVGGDGADKAFRLSTSPANVVTFVANIADFLKTHNLDGVDIDWEYPSEGTDSAQLYRFLIELRNALPNHIISLAVPPSYTNLKGFRLNNFHSLLDYVMFMTYDLHGQWDSGLQNTISGCPTGSCLRSHVNRTETTSALSMITKAGVPSNKVVIGLASYGRSFHMASKGCSGPTCTFTGTPQQSDAKPGRCTQSAGLLAQSEIEEIRSKGVNVQIMFDLDSATDIVVYDDLEWVSYMSERTKQLRTKGYKLWNVGGVFDWAVDMQAPL